MKIIHVSWPLLIITWAIAVYFWIGAYSAPIIYLGGDFVQPKQAKAGQAITITRHMRFLREDKVALTRSMIQGDCRKSCEIVDLPTSQLAISPSTNVVRTRELIIPTHINPGKWKLVFAMQWEGRFGRVILEHLPELEIEVVE